MSSDPAEPIDQSSDQVTLESIKQTVERLGNTFSLIGLLEFRSASLNLTSIIAMAVAIAFLLFTVWLMLMSALALYCHQQQLSWYLIIMIIALLQFVLAVPLIYLIRHCAKVLLFPKTRQAFEILKSN